MTKVIDKLNLAKYITCHVKGSNHSIKHRRITGFFMIIFGAFFIEAFMGLHGVSFHVIGHIGGIFMHGTGIIPFIEPDNVVEFGNKPVEIEQEQSI